MAQTEEIQSVKREMTADDAGVTVGAECTVAVLMAVRKDACKQRACPFPLDDMDHMSLHCVYILHKSKRNVCVCVCVCLRVNMQQYQSLPLQVRLSGCSFMR